MPGTVSSAKLASYAPVYVSYAHERGSAVVVERLREACRDCGIELRIDTEQIPYSDSIRRYMQELGAAGAVVVVLSEAYLKSRFCMFELLEIERHKDFHGRVHPIILRGTPLTEPEDRVSYLEYWEDKRDKLDARLRGLKTLDSIEGIGDHLKLYQAIRTAIAGHMVVLDDKKAVIADADGDTSFQPLIDRLRSSGSVPPLSTMADEVAGRAIRDKVRGMLQDLLRPNPLAALRKALITELSVADAARSAAPDGDPSATARAEAAAVAAVLCDLEIDSAIEALHAAVNACLQAITIGDDPRDHALRQAARRVFGWLLLLSVRDAWAWDRRRAPVSKGAGVTLRLPLRSDAGTEVLLARWDEKGAELAFHPKDGHVIGGGHALAGSRLPLDGWEDPVADVVRSVKRAIWLAVMTDPPPREDFTETDDQKLSYALGIQRRTHGKGHYLTVRSSLARDPLNNDAVLTTLAAQLPSLQVVQIEAEGDGAEVFSIPEWALTTQIEQFLKTLRSASNV